MNDILIEYLLTKNAQAFKEDIVYRLNSKLLENIQAIKESTDISIRNFFDFVGAEDYEETDDHISLVFQNKATLNYALEQLPDDLDYDIFYYSDVYDDSEVDIPEDDSENPVDIDDVVDGDPETQAFELVIYKDDDGDFDDIGESYLSIFSEATDKNLMSKKQLDMLSKEYSKIKKVDPSSPTWKKIEKQVGSMSKEMKQQIIDANIPWLRTAAASSLRNESEEESKDAILEANENEMGRQVKRRVSYAKKRRGGKLINRRQRRRAGKVSKGVGKGYRIKGAGWKTKLIQANRKRKLSKKQNVKAQKMGKRFAARSRAIRKKLGFKKGT